MPRFPIAVSGPRRLLLSVLIGALGFSLAPGAWGRDDVTLIWDPRHSLRGLAETYLRDPDAWPEILRANGLDSARQLQPGMRLEIPVASILALDHALGEPEWSCSLPVASSSFHCSRTRR